MSDSSENKRGGKRGLFAAGVIAGIVLARKRAGTLAHGGEPAPEAGAQDPPAGEQPAAPIQPAQPAPIQPAPAPEAEEDRDLAAWLHLDEPLPPPSSVLFEPVGRAEPVSAPPPPAEPEPQPEPSRPLRLVRPDEDFWGEEEGFPPEQAPNVVALPRAHDILSPGDRTPPGHKRVVLAVALVVVLAAAVAVPKVLSGDKPRARAIPPVTITGQTTFLVVSTVASDLSHQADSLALFALDEPALDVSDGGAAAPDGAGRGRNPLVMFVPTAVLSEIPGQGFDKVGKAYSIGSASLQVTTVENVLGIHVDELVAISDVTLAALVDAAGGIDVEVTERILAPSGKARFSVMFEQGMQRMDGHAAADYFYFRGDRDSELSRFPRMRAVWEGLMQKYAGNPAGFGTLLEGRGGTIKSTAGRAEVLRFFADFIAAGEERVYPVVPVKSMGAGEAYQVDDAALAGFVTEFFAGSSLRKPGQPVARIGVRNGNGSPDTGERVTRLLVRAGMKVVTTGNAPNFDYRKTRIVVYSDDADALALGERVREILGVGEVEVGLQPQTFVDATIFVGEDFLEEG